MSEKWVKLANYLIVLTNTDKLSWQETSDDDQFQTVLGRNAIELEVTGFGDDFEFRIRDSDGRIVDRFTDDDLSRITDQNYSRALSDMIQLIRRRLSGTEQVLDEILDTLEAKDARF